jgi:predicted nucleotidyltransferase
MSERVIMSAQNELDGLVQCITAKHKPKRIFLFGFRAKGSNKPDSDIDLCLIYDQLPKRKLEMLQELYQSLYQMHGLHAVDLLVFQSDAYRERAKQISTIEHAIQREGKLIYGQA